MTFQTKMVCSGIALLALAACGGGGGNDGPAPIVISVDEEMARVFSEGSGDISDVLATGGVLTARQVAETTWVSDFTTGDYTLVDGVFSAELVGDDLVVTFGPVDDQRTFTIVDATTLDQTSFQINNSSIFFDLFISGGQTFAEFLDDSSASGYSTRIGYFYTIDGEEFGFQGDAVIGTETTDAGLDTLASMMSTLEYSGFGRFNIRQADVGFNVFNARLEGNVNLTADFGAGVVSGEMNTLDYQERAGTTVLESGPIAGTITMNPATFDGVNGFAGTMSPDATLAGDASAVNALADAITYSGAFYGPAAEEVGGDFAGSARFEGDDYVAQGHWNVEEVSP